MVVANVYIINNSRFIHKSILVGNGGLFLGSPLIPSIESNNALSSADISTCSGDNTDFKINFYF